MLLVVMVKDYLELQHSNFAMTRPAMHKMILRSSSTKMVAIRDAVVTVPQLSAAMLRRNMQMHCSPTKTIPVEHMLSLQHQVYRACKQLCPTTQRL